MTVLTVVLGIPAYEGMNYSFRGHVYEKNIFLLCFSI